MKATEGSTTDAGGIAITVLVDNAATPGLRPEHGFAAWIEAAGRRVLFDTGQGTTLVENAERLGVDLGTLDALVLSHGHYDHTGGVPHVLSRAPAAEVHAHPASTGCRFSIKDGAARPVDMPGPTRAALDAHPGGVRWTTGAEPLAPGVGLTGEIPRLTDYEDVGGPFFVDADGREADPITDDQALWIRAERGLVVITGCGHAGVVNTLRRALALSGAPRVHAVLGGFHLNAAGERRLSRTIDALRELDPDLIVPCHCTGEAAVERLRQAFGERVVQGSSGAVFRFDRAPERDARAQA